MRDSSAKALNMLHTISLTFVCLCRFRGGPLFQSKNKSQPDGQSLLAKAFR